MRLVSDFKTLLVMQVLMKHRTIGSSLNCFSKPLYHFPDSGGPFTTRK